MSLCYAMEVCKLKRNNVDNPKRKKIFRRRFFIFCFLAFPVINFLIFYVYVNFDAFFMAFQRQIGRAHV